MERPEIFKGRTKEWDKPRQYRSNQGRSPEKQTANYKVMFFSLMGMVVMVIGLVVYSAIKHLFN